MTSMFNYIIKELVESISTNILTNSEAKQLSKELTTYLENLYDRLKMTKNILFRNEPVDFYKNYLPLTLSSKTNSIRVKSPIDLLEKFKKVAVIGPAGSGKTTLLRYLTLTCIEDNFRIPIYIELRNFNENITSFEKFVSSSISDSLISIRDLFKSGKFIFILDGYDEINFIEGRNIIFQIEKFISMYSDNYFIISSRQGTNIESLSQFYVFTVQPLNWNDITLYIEKLELPNLSKNAIINSINENDIFFKYLTNPLFLSLYINYLNIHEINDLPKKKTVFFRNILDTLFSQHDSVSKLGFVREKLSGLNKDELETISTILAFRAFTGSTISFTKDKLYNELELIKKNTKLLFENENLIYDLTITVNILIIESGYYSFNHIVFLEYLTCLFISRLSTEKKAKVYQQLINSERISMSTSFMNFLYELDNLPFVKYYLIPKLESIYYSSNETNSSIMEFISLIARENESIPYDTSYRNNINNVLNYLAYQVNSNEDESFDELLKF